jgi:hypothetical protein
MAYTVRKMNYCYVTVPNRTGMCAAVLGQIKKAGINLQAFSGFPAGGGKGQIDLIAERLGDIRKLARKQGWKLSKAKKGFLIQGSDEVGAIEKHLRKLAQANIKLTAADAVAAGKGRYGMILWVNPKNFNRAARALGAR